jgi:hypothetical protein
MLEIVMHDRNLDGKTETKFRYRVGHVFFMSVISGEDPEINSGVMIQVNSAALGWCSVALTRRRRSRRPENRPREIDDL